MASAAVSLHDKYALTEGRVYLTGIQALVRTIFDAHDADVAAGLRTGTFVSGYQGSPLGGFDQELARRALGQRAWLRHVPGVNEELGATAVWGSQLAATTRGATVDGVVGWWYGKNPGLDRAADAIRHANVCGVGPAGGAVALVGDDPGAGSSTLASASEAMLANLMVPTLAPATLQELLDFGRHAVALSRASGLWSALKVVAAVADGAGTAQVGPDRVRPVVPTVLHAGRPYVHTPDATMLAPNSLVAERTLLGPRLELATAYARANDLNRIVHTGGVRPWLGIVCAGRVALDVEQALADLGVDPEACGVRVLRLGMVWPHDPAGLRAFADGLQEVLVVEEKLPFLEPAVRDALYGTPAAPRVVGRLDPDGRELLAAHGVLDADQVARAIARRLRAGGVEPASVAARLAVLDANRHGNVVALPVVRAPGFCSGCPHAASTAAPEGSLVGAGIGCHTMVLLDPAGRGEVTGVTQMGGEGAQWIGMAPWVSDEHFTQNIGDGTFHHSGSLAVRAAVAAGSHITFKLLANGTVAMTGAQAIVGGMTIPALTRWLALEGVARVVVTTDDVERYRGVALDPIASVRPREALLDVQRELAATPGTTVLVHDQACAAETRRRRRRGVEPAAPRRVAINERVCEGCGDCGAKSGCASVQPVSTEFGRKTQIHQSSCNVDLSCLQGDCPSFVTVDGAPTVRVAPAAPSDLPEPVALHAGDDVHVRMVGIGGTGVVTVSQVLGMAAHLVGRHVVGLDQTGLSQKGGPVVSDVRFATAPISGGPRPSERGVDVLLGLDLLGAADPRHRRLLDPRRTVAVVSTSAVPTGRMVVDPSVSFPALDGPVGVIAGRTRGDALVLLDARALAERLFADHLPANLIVLGAAYQRGVLGLPAAALEAAIAMNGSGAEVNLAAFAWGRACVARPEAVALLDVPAPYDDAGEGLDELVARRSAELEAYGGPREIARYAAFVAEVGLGGEEAVTRAVARQHFKLLAYKDEYEVARLHLDAAETARRRDALGAGKVRYMLHPPGLRALGLDRKLAVPAAVAVPLFGVLRRCRRVRGTALDPFGRTEVRRVERALAAEYEARVRAALSQLSPATASIVEAIASSPDMIRGYETVKLASVQRWRTEVAELEAQLAAASRRTIDFTAGKTSIDHSTAATG